MQINDKVTLNSGSPVLTITEIYTMADVKWVDNNGVQQVGSFDLRCITPVVEAKD